MIMHWPLIICIAICFFQYLPPVDQEFPMNNDFGDLLVTDCFAIELEVPNGTPFQIKESPIHYLGFKGTLKKLLDGGEVQDGTRNFDCQELTKVGWLHLDELVASQLMGDFYYKQTIITYKSKVLDVCNDVDPKLLNGLVNTTDFFASQFLKENKMTAIYLDSHEGEILTEVFEMGMYAIKIFRRKPQPFNVPHVPIPISTCFFGPLDRTVFVSYACLKPSRMCGMRFGQIVRPFEFTIEGIQYNL